MDFTTPLIDNFASLVNYDGLFEYNPEVLTKVEKCIAECTDLKNQSTKNSLFEKYYIVQRGIIQNYRLFLLVGKFSESDVIIYINKLEKQIRYLDSFKNFATNLRDL